MWGKIMKGDIIKAKKKPIIIEAIQYLREENICRVQNFVGESLIFDVDANDYRVKTLEGTSYLLKENDWIIKGVKNEFYPCKPDIFEQTYEEIK